MIRGLYISASSAVSEGKRIDTISNNIANANTTGFKRDILITESFPEILITKMGGKSPQNIDELRMPAPLNHIGTMNAGVHVDVVATDFAQGYHDLTSNPLNVAIFGKGFFTVEANGQERYTRDGSFMIDREGYLVNKDGYKVLGEKGYIKINSEDVKINEKGEITSEGVLIDKLRAVDFQNYNALMKEGNNLYAINSEEWTDNNKAFEGSVRQGFIEGSNVNTVKEMVDMITMLRSYEANQKLIKAHDELLGKAVNEVGKL